MKVFKKIFSTLFILALILQPLITPSSANALVAENMPTNYSYKTIYRYFNTKEKYHYYTANINELGKDSKEFKYEGVVGKIVSPDQYVTQSGFKTLYKYQLKGTKIYKFTTYKMYDTNYEYKELVGYIASYKRDGFTVAVHEYKNTEKNQIKDFLYTNDFNEYKYGKDCWMYLGTIGYFLPESYNPAPEPNPGPFPVPTPIPSPSPDNCKQNCIYRYWSLSQGRHYYTLDFYVLGNGKNGFAYEGALGKYTSSNYDGKYMSQHHLKPLYLYYNHQTDTYRFTDCKINEKNWEYKKQVGVISDKKSDKYKTPMIEYVNTNDYFYTNNPNELGEGGFGWGNKKIIGWLEKI